MLKRLIFLSLAIYALYSLFPEQTLAILEALTQQLNYLAEIGPTL